MKWGIWIFALLLAGYGIVYIFRPQTSVLSYYGYFANNVALLCACISLTRAAIKAPRTNPAHFVWTGLAVGLWMWMVGGMMEVIDFIAHRSPYASLAAIFWITGYLPMLIGFLPAMRRLSISGGKRAVWFVIFLAVGYGSMFYFYLVPHLQDPLRNIPSKLLDVIYSTFNFILLGFLWQVFRRSDPLQRLRSAYVLLTAATIVMIVADVMLSYFTDRESVVYQLLDLPYVTIYFLFFLAGYATDSEVPTNAMNGAPSVR